MSLGSTQVQVMIDMALLNAGMPIAVAGGTVNAITATFTPALTLTDLTKCMVRATGKNTITTPTFAPNGLAAKTIVKKGGSALAANDIPGANAIIILVYNAAAANWEYVNAP